MARHRVLPALVVVLGLSIPAWAAPRPGTVYTLGNEAAGNRVIVFQEAPDGTLAPAGSVLTGGLGTGAGLGSEGALAISRDGRWLLAVNAGSDSVSVLEITASGPVLRDVVPSGGRNPISVALAGREVAVLNAGGAVGAADNVTGFVLGPRGRLVAVNDATRPLSGANVGPAQVGFALDGAIAIVTEKATNRIDTFVVHGDGSLSGPHVTPSAGMTPFGFAIAGDGLLVVSEAAGGAPNASTASSYEVEADGALAPITGALHTGQTAACWTATSRDGRLAYMANTGSSDVTGFSIATDGALALFGDGGATGSTGAGSAPVDVTFSRDQRFLYVLDHNTNTIAAFAVADDGALASRGLLPGVPPAAAGLVAR